jgi:pimeloyl-ACP methyl ester carboxylesterase
MYYETQGSGDPLVLIPFLSADNACYAFQLPTYSEHFTCYSIDPRGAGNTDKPDDVYTTELMADDVAAFIDAMELRKPHVVGVSMGAGVALQLASRFPDKIKSLSLHGGWVKTDQHLASLVNTWKIVANSIGNVLDAMATAVFPLCVSPELYSNSPEYVKGLYDFMKSRPQQPVYAFLRQCDAVLAHDCMAGLEKIKAPTYITYGDRDLITPPLIHGEIMKNRIKYVELEIFNGCLHSPILEKTEIFNQKSLEFLKKHSS